MAYQVVTVTPVAAGTYWEIETADSVGNVGAYTSIALGTGNYPHVSYFDLTNYDLKYAYKDGTGWHTETADSVGSVGEYTSIALDGSNYPHISYYDSTNTNLKYACKDGTGWHLETADLSAGDVGCDTSIAMDGSNYPHISYFDNSNYELKYAYKDGTGWHTETADSDGSVGYDTSIALGTGNYPHISYHGGTSIMTLKYAYKDAGGWHTETADSSVSLVGAGTSIALDTGNYPHISHSDGALLTLKYTYKDAGGWHTETADSAESVGWHPSIALDGSDSSYISYYDTPNNDLKYARQLVDNTPPSDPTDVTSTSHAVGTRSRDNTVDVAWTAATDTDSGLDGYSVLWDTNDTTIPDQTKDIEEVVSTTSPALADGDSHYLHISSVDNAGNWQSTVHLGPFVIDTTRIGSGGSHEGPDFTAPKISGLRCSNASLNGITITWETNEPSTSQVEYWASEHQFSPSDEELTEYHEVELTGLNPCSTYNYCTISVDASGNEKVSGEQAFTTLGEPASFTVSDLSVSQVEVEVGEEITVAVLVSNTGDACGTYIVKLKVDGVAVDSREVTLDGGAGEEIILTTYMNVPGTCSIDVNGLSGTVMVEAPLPPPPPPPAPTPEPTSPVPPAPTPPEGDNRLLIAAIITASTAAGLGGYYRVRRRRAKGSNEATG